MDKQNNPQSNQTCRSTNASPQGDELPPLPKPVRMSSDQAYLGYTADQMREYGAACRVSTELDRGLAALVVEQLKARLAQSDSRIAELESSAGAADALDAARYRFLRDEKRTLMHRAPHIARETESTKFGVAWVYGDEADRIIDAARNTQPGGAA